MITIGTEHLSKTVEFNFGDGRSVKGLLVGVDLHAASATGTAHGIYTVEMSQMLAIVVEADDPEIVSVSINGEVYWG